MANKPDFIVDQNGNVRDVRYTVYSNETSSSQERGTGSSTQRQIRQADSNQKPGGGVVWIPIGLIFTLILVAFRMCLASKQENLYTENNVKTLNRGMWLYNSGDYEKAIMEFDDVIDSQPEMGEAYNDRAIAYFAIGEIDQALEDLNKAIELMKNPALSYNNRGYIYYFEGNYRQAIDDLEKAIELSPHLAKAYHIRGLVAMDMGNFKNAIADFDKAIEFTDENLFSLKATVDYPRSQDQGQFTESISSLFMSLEYDADLPYVYADRAIAYLNEGKLEKASEDLDDAVRLGLDPELAQQIKSYISIFGHMP